MQAIICFVLLLLVAFVVGKTDIDALLELKRGFQTDNSGKILDSWDPKSLASDDCPKFWHGIICSNGHVASITLNNLGLVGEFSFPAISRLQMLQNLSLSNNQLSGTVTKDIGSLSALQYLDLSRNSFTGSIPSELTSLENLVLVNFSSNNFEGEVPSGFDSFKVLKYLDFHSNGFVGDVMSLLGRLGSVQIVDLSCNKFSGSLDMGLGNPDFISSISYLNISYNNLTGELFPHDGIPYFDSLEVFDAGDNRFSGNVPSFSFVVSLGVIRLRNNKLSGSLPEGLLQESSMVLSELDLSHNELEGPIESITSLNLLNLNLSSNRLSGPLPARIGHCAVIDLSNNMLSGNISRIQGWGNYVEIINLSSNRLTGLLPNQTSQFLRLISIKVYNNSLQGTLPPVLGLYPELKSIDLSLNNLTGLLLPALFNSTKLTDINLSLNNFSGALPVNSSAMQNYSLTSLNLSHNALTGQLPPELGIFRYIELLDLSDNGFDGVIPDGLSDTLSVFNVSYNNLLGVVPRSLLRFPSSSFHPGNNLLVIPNEGSLPEGGDDLVLRRHGGRMKSAMRAALIAGVIGGVCVIAILTVLIYYRVHGDGGKAKASTGNGGKEVLPSLPSDSTDNQPSTAQNTKDLIQQPESAPQKAEAAPSSGPIASENPGALRVCSPDKLAGDLHLFDSSWRFSSEELSSAPAEAVGMSCHGTLYKAVLPSGCVLAVKLLKEGIAKGRKEFAREAKKLGNIRHPNLVTLQGFYWGPKEHEKLIISKFVDAQCLAVYLHGTDPASAAVPPLTLPDRLKVSLDVARCLAYLHTKVAIPHGNLKSTNILVQIPDVNALLTDYSLHRLLTPAGTAEQVLNAGALGYLPPEFTSSAKPCPSLKSDVYAFGILILELLTGRSSADIVTGNQEVVDLCEWVSLMAVDNRVVECLDSRVVGSEGLPDGIEDFLRIGLRCVLPADERPDMRVIVEELSSIVL